MAREFVCEECESEKGRGCRIRDANHWAVAPARCPYDGGWAKWREVVPDGRR